MFKVCISEIITCTHVYGVSILAVTSRWLYKYIYGLDLVQVRRNSSVDALELRLSCTNQSICKCITVIVINLFSNGVILQWHYFKSIGSAEKNKLKTYLGLWRPVGRDPDGK